MRRAVARGRVFPQSFSTDRRYGRLSVKAVALFPLIWVNADDQGRLCGDPEEIKYSCCPNIDHITKSDVPGLLRELADNDLILCYKTSKSAAIQILDWWDPHRSPQWAWPSDYPPPEGWTDHLRYKKDSKTVITQNWPVSGEEPSSSQVSDDSQSGERSGERSGGRSGEEVDGFQVSADSQSGERSGEKPRKAPSFPRTPILTSIKGDGKGGGRGKRNSPEGSGEKPSSPSLADLERENEERVYGNLVENFRMRWGRVSSKNPNVVIPRPLKAEDEAKLRDLAKEITAAGGCEEPMIKKAFDEAAGAEKLYISYVRGILLDWLGVDRKHHGT